MGFSSTPRGAQAERPSRVWVGMLVVGILLSALGLAAMGALALSGRAFVLVLGWLLVGAAVLQIGGAFLFQGSGGLGAELIFGALGIMLGMILLWFPVAAGSLIALLIVGGLILDAVLEGARAVVERRYAWWAPALIALLSILLGVAIILNPTLLLSMLGFLVGVNLLIRGVTLLLSALEVRKLTLANAVSRRY